MQLDPKKLRLCDTTLPKSDMAFDENHGFHKEISSFGVLLFRFPGNRRHGNLCYVYTDLKPPALLMQQPGKDYNQLLAPSVSSRRTGDISSHERKFEYCVQVEH